MEVPEMVNAFVLVAIAALVAGCAAGEDSPVKQAAGGSWTLSSPAFKQGAPVPVRFTCEGPNVSPPLEWTEPPAGTKALVLVMDDPDAPRGTWTHWAVAGLAPSLRKLPEALTKTPEGAVMFENDAGKRAYFGPCPPPGKMHHYHFKLFALREQPKLDPATRAREVEKKIASLVIGKAELIGTYERR